MRDRGSTLLVDAGRSPREAVEALAALGVRSLDAVILTHPDADHVGGLPLVLAWLKPRQLIVAAQGAERGEVVQLLRVARRVGVRERLVGAGQRLVVGSLVIDVLSPGAEVWSSDNDASLVAAIRCGGVRLLVTGDIEAAGERELLAAGRSVRAAVLQLPHHGSRTSSTAPFLAAVDPAVALAATGERPRFRYPHPEVARRVREGRTVLVVQTQGVRQLTIESGWLQLGTSIPVRVRAHRGGR
ncbi:MAG: MBL fold metallo-hydrolase [Thermoanaerobaculaceae bacterium]|nr:MBL fold metallo-hydrolase [Thermoanaerobaculaceae bacterium]